MRTFTNAAAIVAMLAIPGAAFAAQATTTAPAAKKATVAQPVKTVAPAKKKAAAVSAHTTSGTVKSASDTSLVISKAGKDKTFVVNATTEKKGTIEAGAKVNVHYTLDGTNMVATAITATPKAAAKAKGKK